MAIACDRRISETVDRRLAEGAFWPAPLIQLNPSFAPGGSVANLVAEGLLHTECERLFALNGEAGGETTRPLKLYKRQRNVIETARTGDSYVLTTHTGSGKSLAYTVAILDIYHGMCGAIKTGQPNQTRLDPPPGPAADAEGNTVPLPRWSPGRPRPSSWARHMHAPREVYDRAKANYIDWHTLLEPFAPSAHSGPHA